MKKQLLSLIASALTGVARACLIPPSRLNCYEPVVPAALRKQD